MMMDDAAKLQPASDRTPEDPEAIKRFYKTHETFKCRKLKARITHRQCEANQRRVREYRNKSFRDYYNEKSDPTAVLLSGMCGRCRRFKSKSKSKKVHPHPDLKKTFQSMAMKDMGLDPAEPDGCLAAFGA